MAHKIVIQYVGDDVSQPFFRMIAYDALTLQLFEPSRFESLDQLLEAMYSAFPDFEQSWFSIRQVPATYIVFAGERELSSTQLSILSLKRRR